MTSPDPVLIKVIAIMVIMSILPVLPSNRAAIKGVTSPLSKGDIFNNSSYSIKIYIFDNFSTVLTLNSFDMYKTI